MEHATDNLSATFSALGDPTRRAMLARLAKGSATVGELAQPFRGAMSLPAITKHVQVLERAGLVTKARDAQWRPCQLNGEALRSAANWLEAYRDAWEESLDRLGEFLKQTQPAPAATPTPRKAAPLHRNAAKSAKSVKSTRSVKSTKSVSSKTVKPRKPSQSHDPKQRK